MSQQSTKIRILSYIINCTKAVFSPIRKIVVIK